MRQRLFRFSDLHKSFGELQLLDIEALEIHTATTLLLSGQNGAGKTTLMKIIAGLEKPDSARISNGGPEANWSAMRQQLLSSIVYLHQQPYLFNTSVAENVAYGLKQRGVPRAELMKKVSEGLAWAGLSHLAERHAQVLSIGEKQRVALTRAHVIEPRILLMDEPMASMDQASRQQTLALLKQFREDGVSIVLCSHELDDVLPLCDHHLRLENGRLAEQEML